MIAAARCRRCIRTNTDPVDALEFARISARDDDLLPPCFASAPEDLVALVRYRCEFVKDRNRGPQPAPQHAREGPLRGSVRRSLVKRRVCGVAFGSVRRAACGGLRGLTLRSVGAPLGVRRSDTT